MLSLIFHWQAWIQTIKTYEEGQGLIEYAMILLFVAIAIVVSLITTGEQLNVVYAHIITTFNEWVNGT